MTDRWNDTETSERIRLHLTAVPTCLWYRLYVRVVAGDRRTGYLLRHQKRRNALLLVCQHGLTRPQVEGRGIDGTVVWYPTLLQHAATCTITVERVLDAQPSDGAHTPAALPSVLDLLTQSVMQSWMRLACRNDLLLFSRGRR